MGKENPAAAVENKNTLSKKDIYKQIKLSLESEDKTGTGDAVRIAGQQSAQAAAYAASALGGSKKSSAPAKTEKKPAKVKTDKNSAAVKSSDSKTEKMSADAKKAEKSPAEPENKSVDEQKKRDAEKAAAEISAAAEKASNKRTAPTINEISSEQPARQSRRKRTKNKNTVGSSKSAGTTAALAALSVLVVFGLVYTVVAFSYRDKFLPNTYVNGVNISGMTSEEAEKAIIENVKDDEITFVEQDGEKVVFTGDQYESTYKLPSGSLDDASAENRALWLGKFIKGSDYNVSLEHTYSDDAIKEIVSEYDWGYVAPKNAEIVSDESGKFSIKPEDNGNSVKTDVLGEYAVEQMKSGVNEIVMTDSNCYEKAKVTSEDLVDTLDLYNRIGNISINFEMTNREEIFDPVGTENIDYKTIADWLTVVDDKVVVDSQKAQDWVRENIAQKYDTYVEGYTRQFTTTMDGTIELPLGYTGIYGWATDVEATADKLIQLIMAGESCSTEPVYSQEGFRMHSEAEGYSYTKKTYIEVSLSRQHLWYYVDGDLFLESDVVTGMSWDPARQTPPGVFRVWSVEANVILGTYAIQGYECPVDFWMPIDYTGIGLHDLYHASYGGNVRDWEGSHGCINLPWDTASAIYNQCVVGTPVVITP